MLTLVCVVLGVVVAVFLLTALIGAPYVPTKRREAHGAFTQLRPLTANDVVLDIGSGDGAVLAEVCARGARAVGYEINPLLVLLTHWRLRRYGAACRVVVRDFWRTPFPDDTTVVYTFGDSRDIRKMYDKVASEAARLGRTLDFVSYAFEVPGKKPHTTYRAHHLYKVSALHPEAA